MSPQVDIVVPVFNEPARLLRAALQSLQHQTLNDWRAIVVDDGSTNPETVETLRAIAQEDSRFRVISTPNAGQTVALTRGIEASTAPLVARQDADDLSLPTRLETQVHQFKTKLDLGLVGTWYQYCDEDGARLHVCRLPTSRDAINRVLRFRNAFGHGSVMFRREAYESVGGYSGHFLRCQDYDLFSRMAERFESSNIPEPLYLYRLRSGSQSYLAQDDFALEAGTVRVLIEQREAGREANIAEAFGQAMSAVQSRQERGRILAASADQAMFGGSYVAAVSRLLRSIAMGNKWAWVKLLRLGVWLGCPPVRRFLFRSRVTAEEPMWVNYA